MTTTEAADRLAAMYPGRLQSVTETIITLEDGNRITRYHLYVEGSGHGLHADRERLEDAFADIARIAPDTTENEEEQGDGEEVKAA
jgi:hypothetical protein